MAVQSKATRKAAVDAVYVNNVTQNTENSDLNTTYTNEIDSSLSVAAGEALQTVQSPVNFTGGLQQNGSDIVGLCGAVTIETEQDWIDNSTLVISGIRSLNASVKYVICGTVSRSFSLQTNGVTVICGDSASKDKDIYTGTGFGWIVGAANDILQFNCVTTGANNGSATFIDTTNQLANFGFDNCVIDYAKLGNMNAQLMSGFSSQISSGSQKLTAGMVINSTSVLGYLLDTISVFVDDAYTGNVFDVSSATVYGTITFNTVGPVSAGVNTYTFINGNGDSNFIGGARGRIIDCNLTGAGAPLGGISKDNIKWNLRDNRGIENTMPDSHATCLNRVTATTTPAGSIVEVGGGSASADANDDWADIDSSQFTLDPETGRITYIGLDPIKVPIHFGCTLNPVAGTNKNVYIYIGKGLSGDANPTAITASRSETRVDAGDPKPLQTFAQPIMNTGDYISPMVSLKTGESATNILCTNNKVLIN